MLKTSWVSCARWLIELRTCTLRYLKIKTRCFRLLYCFSFGVVNFLLRWFLAFWITAAITNRYERKMCLNIGKILLLVRVGKHWNRLPKESLFMETQWDTTLSHVLCSTQLWAGSIALGAPVVPSPVYSSGILILFCHSFAGDWVNEHIKGNAEVGAVCLKFFCGPCHCLWKPGI